ncbi:MAG: peptidoglycan bridge formation glycyltransferase FemA/FemB family protein [Acidimicrobiia bacterium]
MTASITRASASLHACSSAVAVVENQSVHEEWDEYLARTPGGDVTQTSGWARLKRASGFMVHRVVLREAGMVAGGAQMLARPVGHFGAVAYLPNGPVLPGDTGIENARLFAARLVDECRRCRIRAVFVQPPAEGDLAAVALRAVGFRPSAADVAPSASLRIDVSRDDEELLGRMTRHTRADFRRSQRESLTVRSATRDELLSFHDLHCSSAARHGFAPTPLAYLESMWDELHPAGQIEVLLVDSDGRDLAGLVLTRLGDVVTNRLFGFDPDRLPRRMRPSEALNWAAIHWARERGARWYDLGGVGRAEAMALASGAARSGADEHHSPWAHKIRMGGTPVILPEPLELIQNRLLRAGFGALSSRGPVQRLRRSVEARWRIASNVGSSQRLPTHELRQKRILDVALASALLAVLSPLLALVAVAIRLTGRGPVLFRQERIGWKGRPFTLLKFRTMVPVNDDDDCALREIIELELSGLRVPEDGSFKLGNDPRITRLGRWLRRTSIDELPQLINVVRAEMSLVGPRPALPWEVELFPPEYRRRTDVPPGITGLWQVSGRSLLTTPEMLRLDLEYVNTRSIRLDLSILGRTIPVVVRGDGGR